MHTEIHYVIRFVDTHRLYGHCWRSRATTPRASYRYADTRVGMHGHMHMHAIMQVVRLLLALKRDYPGRVVLIIGNR